MGALWGRAAGTVDRAAVACRRVALYTAMNRFDAAVEAGLEFLRQVGIDWSPHPTEDDVKKEYDALWRRLGDRPIEALVDLPRMIDPERRVTIDVLGWLGTVAFVTDTNFLALVHGRATNISLEYGNGDSSPLHLCGRWNNYWLILR